MAKKILHKVLVAINGRQSSVHAAMYAIMLAKGYGLDLKFVYVVDTATIKYLTMNNLLINDEKIDFEKRLNEDGDHYLTYVQMLASTKGVKSEKDLRCGGVFNEILKCAEEYEADLIILGGNEKKDNSVSKKNMLNSDENEVLKNSKCPVLIVQKPNIEAEFKVF